MLSTGYRFIPAGAGNTLRFEAFKGLITVYPRWRGEHGFIKKRLAFCGGLSPLARGTQCYPGVEIWAARFIPAGAGNTHSSPSTVLKNAVYPRWRGEHINGVRLVAGALGLSPLARGTHLAGEQTAPRPRFIPAGAGNTVRKWSSYGPDPVYPRWRGEHSPGIYIPLAAAGLSPLARGTLVHKDQLCECDRFIPAGAGNTIHNALVQEFRAVYPRWRGEHSHPPFLVCIFFGLSPLARGTP